MERIFRVLNSKATGLKQLGNNDYPGGGRGKLGSSTAKDVLLTLPCLIIVMSGMECITRAEADIVLLVDGSWSIGRANFRTVRSFISRIVEVFDIGPKRVQIGRSDNIKDISTFPLCCLIYANANGVILGLTQYSGDPRTEWQLNAHRDKKSLLQAVANLPYKGGNTLTGE